MKVQVKVVFFSSETGNEVSENSNKRNIYIPTHTSQLNQAEIAIRCILINGGVRETMLEI